MEITEMKYRKKPIEVEALQFDGSMESADAIFRWSKANARKFFGPHGGFLGLVIRTMEGDMRAVGGDWVIRGVEGEYYPCKPTIFAKTYEPVEV